MYKGKELTMIEEQSIKAARLAYWVLITACLTALLFAFSPEETDVYKEAGKELNTLLFNDLDLFVGNLQCEIALKDDRYKKNFLHVDQILSDYGLSLSPLGKHWGVLSIEPQPLGLSSGPGLTLDQIDEYFSRFSELSITITKIDKEFEQELRNFLNTRKDLYGEGRETVSIYTTETNFMVTFHRNSGGGTSTGDKLRNPPKKEHFTLPLNILLKISEIPELSRLVRQLNEHYIFLPNLKQVWDQIRSETPDQARTILARKDIQPEKRLVVFGFSIAQDLVSWTIPGLIFVLSFYFLIHIQHLNLVVNSNPAFRYYPWVGIMPGCNAAIVFMTSLLILPILALFGIVKATWGDLPTYLRILAILLSVGSLITIIVAMKNTIVIKGRIQSLE